MSKQFEEKEIASKVLEDVFSINTVQQKNSLSHKLHNLSEEGLLYTGIALGLAFVLFYFSQSLLSDIEDYILYLFFVIGLVNVINLLIFLSTDYDSQLTNNKESLQSNQQFKQAIVYAIVAAIFIALPSLLTTENRGCCPGWSTDNIQTTLDFDTNQSKDLPKESYDIPI